MPQDKSLLEDRLKLARLFVMRCSETVIPDNDHLEMVVDIIEGETCCGTCASFSHLNRRCFYGVEECHLLKNACCEWAPADTEGS